MKRGFTLIELLAVIVILAIIALIATPIVLNIIKDSKISSEKRSIDMYGDAVINAVASYQLKEGKSPSSFSNIESYIEYNGAKVICETRKVYSTGKIYLSKCKVNNGSTVNYSYGEREKVCKATTGGGSSVGDMITCGTESFYVISNNGTTIDMLAQYNLNIGDNKYPNDPEGLQSINADGYFDSTGYGFVVDYMDKGSTNYTDQNDNILLTYKNLLLDIGIDNPVVKLGLEKQQLINLGCTIDTEHASNSCTSSVPWLKGMNYWLALAPYYGCADTPDESYWEYKGFFETNGDIYGGSGAVSGVRPVVAISVSEI